MSEMNVIIINADQTKKAEVTLDGSMSVRELLDSTIANWGLPTDNTTFAIHNKSQNSQLLRLDGTLASENVQNNDRLIVSWQTEGGVV